MLMFAQQKISLENLATLLLVYIYSVLKFPIEDMGSNKQTQTRRLSLSVKVKYSLRSQMSIRDIHILARVISIWEMCIKQIIYFDSLFIKLTS